MRLLVARTHMDHPISHMRMSVRTHIGISNHAYVTSYSQGCIQKRFPTNDGMINKHGLGSLNNYADESCTNVHLYYMITFNAYPIS